MNIIFTILFLFISGTVYAQECTQPSCFQQKDKELTGLANTTSAADRVPWYIDANGNMDLAPFTAFGRSIVGAANAGEVNTILGVSLITTHPRVTVATLPAVPVTNEVVVVTDALAASSCIVNGGTTNVTCQWTGTAWVAIGGGGGGGAVAGTDTQVQFNDSNIMAGDAGLTYDKASNVLTVTGDVIVAGQSVCQEDGTNCPSGGAPAFNTVTAGTNTDKLVIGTGGTLGVSGTGTITPQYTPSGNIAATTVQGAIAELDAKKQPVDADLTALAGNSTAGFWAAATNVVRSMATADANNLTIANPAGVAGNPTWAVGPNVFLSSRSHTQTTGDLDFSLASSFIVKGATGYTPTAARSFGYNNTTNRYVGGNGTTTKTFAFFDEIQPLSSNLTALSGLTGAAAKFPYFTAAGTMDLSQLVLCTATGGNVLHITSVTPITWSCDAGFASTISGLSTGTLPKAASSSTLTNSLLSESGSVMSLNGTLAIGSIGTDSFKNDTSDITGNGHVVVQWLYRGASSVILPFQCEEVLEGHIAIADAAGCLVDGGVAGAGDVTLVGTQELTNKTIKNADAGGTGNVVTIGIAPFWDAASLTLPSTSTCTLAATAAINSGPSVPAVNCTDAATSIFEGQITLRQAVATVTFTLTVNDVDSSAQHFGGGFKAMCRANAATVNSTWGTAQTVDITMTTANVNYTGTTAAVTPNGTCSSGATLFWQFVADNAGTYTDDGDARVLGVLMKQAS